VTRMSTTFQGWVTRPTSLNSSTTARTATSRLQA
jgi:hypothetical protein